MPHENVEKVKRIYEVFSATLELPREGVADDAQLDGRGAMPDLGVVSDADTAAEAMRSYAEMFESYSVTLKEVIHASDDLVVTAVLDVGRVKGSSSEIRNRFFHVIAFREGLIAHVSSFTNRQEALTAAGLSD